ncbi:MAG: CHAT domain-containing protein [Saprospiraceae bacterium]|nr:CHAT domain-containing protein [Saprospiraceae bacterium]
MTFSLRTCIVLNLLSILLCVSATPVFQGNFRNVDALIEVADSLFIFEDYTRAENVYKQVLTMIGQTPNTPEYLHTLNRVARSAIEGNNLSTARNNLESADQFWQNQEELNLQRAETLKEWGIYYSRLKDYGLAQDYFNKCLELIDNCCPGGGEIIGNIYLDIGDFLLYQDDTQSEKLANQAVKNLLNSSGIKRLQLAAGYNLLGAAVRARGETELRNNYISAALAILNQFSTRPFSLSRDIFYNLGVQYIDGNEFAKAEKTFSSIINLIESKNGSARSQLPVYYALKGISLEAMHDPQASIILLQVEKHLLEQPQINHGHLGYVYQGLGRHYGHNRQSDSARFYFNRAIEQYLVDSNTHQLSELYQDQSRMELASNNLENALEKIDTALLLIDYNGEELFDQSKLIDINIDDFFNPLELKGRILRQLFEMTENEKYLFESLAIYQHIEQIAEFTRNGPYSEGTKILVSEHFYRSAEGALQTLTNLNNRSPLPEYISTAFSFMEHNRYAELVHDLSQARSFVTKGLKDSISDQNLYFTSTIQKLQMQLDNASANESILITDSLFKIRNDYNVFRNQLASDFPGEFLVRYDSMISLAQIQSRLEPDLQLFEYFWGDSDLFLVTFTRDSAILASIPIASVELSLSRLLSWMDDYLVPDSLLLSYSDFAQLANSMYNSLVAPYLLDKNQLLILADGPLAFFPFEVMITDTVPDSHFKNAPYLLKQHEIRYSYSANWLYKMRQGYALKRPHILAMSYTATHEENKFISSARQQDYKDLPFSAQEVEAIANRMKDADVTKLTGTQATKKRFLELAPNYDLIHLAVHGIGDTANALNSHLIFKNADSLESRLFAYELYDLDLKARLAILSACETGVGKAYKGEGVFSIARGFAYANIPSIVMSLWKANDQATFQIMDYFYEYLNQGVSVSKAIQMAKLEYLEVTDPHGTKPFFWAGFVPMGDISPVIEPKNKVFSVILLISALIIMITLIRYRLS